jgi:hypothetical protein
VSFCLFFVVWASIDQGVSWVPLISNDGINPYTNASAKSFTPRYGHSSKVTMDGVILVWGGITRTSTFLDLWMSFDGGFNFVECPIANNPPFLTEGQGSVITSDGELIVMGGYDSTSGLFLYSVSKTNFSLNNPTLLAAMCNGTQLPADGVGLQSWPLSINLGSRNVCVQWYLKFLVVGFVFQMLLL